MSLNTVFSRPFLLCVGLIERVVSMVTEHVHFCLFTSLTPELIISVQVHVVVKRKEKKVTKNVQVIDLVITLFKITL